ncbi:MAG: PTS sugar transporter subunit IIB [Tetragenococcus koreensis]|nr:PTS sugar transporter subunit IIB [Tetragenococcus koreensis]
MKPDVKLVRIDNRLLHATIALNWNRFVNANHILIVNSKYESDQFLEEIMQIVSPNSLDYFLKHKIVDQANIIILFKNLESLKIAVDNGFYFSEIQIPYIASRVLLKNMADYFAKDEVKIIRDIQDKGMKFYFQTAPTDTKDYNFFLNE